MSAWRLRHHNVATSVRHVVALCTLALSSTKDMASKNLSSCHRKLSNSRASLDPLEGFGFRHMPHCSQPSYTESGRPSILLPAPATWLALPSLCPQRLPSLSNSYSSSYRGLRAC
ncbi:hypothetical protein AMTRI_Chr04g244900 [Amborella trichopoda]